MKKSLARKEYENLLNEGVKPVKKWAMSDRDIKPHYQLFQKWFKACRDNGMTIGIETGAARGTILLLERDFILLKERFLSYKESSGGIRKYNKKEK